MMIIFLRAQTKWFWMAADAAC